MTTATAHSPYAAATALPSPTTRPSAVSRSGVTPGRSSPAASRASGASRRARSTASNTSALPRSSAVRRNSPAPDHPGGPAGTKRGVRAAPAPLPSAPGLPPGRQPTTPGAAMHPDRPTRTVPSGLPARFRRCALSLVLGLGLVASACAAPGAGEGGAGTSGGTQARSRPWDEVVAEAQGQTVDLWMYGGDERGNAYVDDVLAPGGAGARRHAAPGAGGGHDRGDPPDARRSAPAGTEDGKVDLVWVNGDNFATGQQAGAWLCGWSDDLPNAAYVTEDDPLVTEDFGVPVDGCEAPWHKAQFTPRVRRGPGRRPADDVRGAAALGPGPPRAVHLPGSAGLHRLGLRPRGAVRRLRRRRRGAHPLRPGRLRRADSGPVAAPVRPRPQPVARGQHLPA